jgi:hypothetical protein
MPALTNGSSYTVVGIKPALPATCTEPLGDGAGNVYVAAQSGGAGSDNQAVFNRTTAIVPDQLTVSSLQAGFSGFTAGTDGISNYTGFKPDGSPGNSTALHGTGAIASPSTKGSAVVSFTCSQDASAVIAFTLQLFDEAAALASTVTFSETGCPSNGGVLGIDTSGNVLVAFPTGGAGLFGIAANDTALRWFDPVNRVPLTGWFTRQGTGNYFALIGGGFATHFADGTWKFIPSGKAEFDAAPSFLDLETGKFPVIVRGGKAYAMITGSTGIPDIVLADGTACGPLPGTSIAASDSFAIGKDGTLIDLKGAGNCNLTVFPQALQ